MMTIAIHQRGAWSGGAWGALAPALALALLLAPLAAQAQPTPEGRWRADERCPGQPPRSFVLTSDGTMLTARLASDAQGGFSSILGFAPLLPGGRFAIDIAAGGGDAKSSYTGRLRPDRTGSADGGAWAGSNFTPCQLRISWLGAPGGDGGATQRTGKPEPAPGVSAGRPEPIPSNRPPSNSPGPTTAGRPEPIAPAPALPTPAARAPAAPAPAAPAAPAARAPAAGTLPLCEDDGPPASALGPGGVWGPICTPRSGRATVTPAPAPPPATSTPAPAPAPARTTPPPASNSETEALRRQLEDANRRAAEAQRQAEEDRRRAEAAERAMRLNESLGRQGRN